MRRSRLDSTIVSAKRKSENFCAARLRPVTQRPMTGAKPTSRSPWLWIPSLYFAEGLPYALVMSVSVVVYKNLGVSNAAIAFCTSLLGCRGSSNRCGVRWWTF